MVIKTSLGGPTDHLRRAFNIRCMRKGMCRSFAKMWRAESLFIFVTTEYIFLKLCISLYITHTNSGKEIQIFYRQIKHCQINYTLKDLSNYRSLTLDCCSLVFRTTSVVQTINRYSLYGQLLPTEKRHFRYFQYGFPEQQHDF